MFRIHLNGINTYCSRDSERNEDKDRRNRENLSEEFSEHLKKMKRKMGKNDNRYKIK